MSRKQKIHKNPFESFICKSCGNAVIPLITGGSQRNHCPFCLCSLHVDVITGDRRSMCKGIMHPISIWIQDSREWSLIHRCETCGMIKTNRIAADDNEILLFSIAASFMAQLPFPASKAINSIRKISGAVYEKFNYEK